MRGDRCRRRDRADARRRRLGGFGLDADDRRQVDRDVLVVRRRGDRVAVVVRGDEVQTRAVDDRGCRARRDTTGRSRAAARRARGASTRRPRPGQTRRPVLVATAIQPPSLAPSAATSSGWMRSAPSGSLFRQAGVRKIWLALCMRRWPATSVNGYAGSPASAAGSRRAEPLEHLGHGEVDLAVGVLHELEDLVVLVRGEDEPRAAREQLLERAPRRASAARPSSRARAARRSGAPSPSGGRRHRAAPRRPRRRAASGRGSRTAAPARSARASGSRRTSGTRASSSCRDARRRARGARRARPRSGDHPWRGARGYRSRARGACPRAARRAARAGERSFAATRR